MEKSVFDYLKKYEGQYLKELGTGFTSWLNGKLIKIDESETIVEFLVRSEMLNAAKVLHGGIHTAILDEVIGMTISVMKLKELYLTVNMAIDLMGRAVEGEIVTAKAHIRRQGKTIINAEGELYNSKGELISRLTTNLANTHIPFEIKL